MQPEDERPSLLSKARQFAQRPVPITRRQFLSLLAVAGAAGGTYFYLGTQHASRMQDSIRLRVWLSSTFDEEPELRRARAVADAIRPLFPRKGEPRWGDWLAYFPEPGQTFNEYARAGVALHELGHMFGIWHCRAYECCMNGANTMRETDAVPLAFCPECDAKVLWRFRLAPVARYERLAQYAQARDLPRDAALWKGCADAARKLEG